MVMEIIAPLPIFSLWPQSLLPPLALYELKSYHPIRPLANQILESHNTKSVSSSSLIGYLALFSLTQELKEEKDLPTSHCIARSQVPKLFLVSLTWIIK